MTTADFAKRAAIFVSIALVPVLIWFLFDVILIMVGAFLIATLLNLGSQLFQKIRFPYSVALVLSGLLIVIVLAGAAYLFGSSVVSDLSVVIDRVEEARQHLEKAMQGSQFGRVFLSHLQNVNVPIGEVIGGFFRLSATFILAIIVTIFGGVYLAAQPRLYRAGISKLFPESRRQKVSETLDHLEDGLRLWLLGQLIQMVIIGVLSGVAVWLVGLPSALALGVIAAVMEFIPYLGPILAAVPAVLVAVTVDVSAIVWTIVAYILIHQAEGHLIMPLIQRQLVFIPPAVMLLSITAITALFGWTGTIFAAPITVMLFVLINKLYVRDTLAESAYLPGESETERRLAAGDLPD